MTQGVPSTVETKFHRTVKGGWLVTTKWKTSDGLQRCVVLDVPDGLLFDAMETTSRLLKSAAFGRRDNAEELLPDAFR
jgi:hypothetical protein